MFFNVKLGFLLISSTFVAGLSQRVNYDGYKIARIIPESANAVSLVLAEMQLLDGMSSLSSESSARIGDEWELLLAPEITEDALRFLDKNEIQYRITIPDVGRHIANEKVHYGSREGKLRWDEYYDLAGIYEYLQEQAAANPSLVTLQTIGTTFEGRDLIVIKISNDTAANKPVVWIDSNMHAREWITGAVCTHIIDQLINGPDAEMQALLMDFDFYILPMANPDGYVYTHDVDRFWRKTRSNTSSSQGCVGADPNRNYDAFWMEAGGASPDPCSLVYGGASPFSEPETNATANFLKTIGNRLVFYLSLHSAGQYILLPTGRDAVPIPEYDTYKRIADLAAVAHFNRHDMNFTAGNIVELMYVATGSSMDWAYTQLTPKAKLHFTYELRDKGQYGHLLPADQILPSCEEFIDGFKVTMTELKALP